MSKIEILDKQFETFLSEEVIQNGIAKVAEQIQLDYKDKNPIFVCVLNGAFMFGADLFKLLEIRCRISFVKMASYEGTESSGKMRYLIGLNEKLYNEHVVVVEDIVDTGNTLGSILPQIREAKPASIEVATLLYKPQAYQASYPIRYIGLEIPNDFIVGYGLDYNGYGRNLREIYKICE